MKTTKITQHHSKDVFKVILPKDKIPLFFWKAKEFEKKTINPRLMIALYFFIFAIIVFSLFTDNIFLAIIFIIFGAMFYFFSIKNPETYTFGITSDGIFAQDHIYEFSSLENFWIFFEPNGKKELSLKSNKIFMPYISVPLGSADPVKVRKIMLNFLPEVKHNYSFSDILDKLF